MKMILKILKRWFPKGTLQSHCDLLRLKQTMQQEFLGNVASQMRISTYISMNMGGKTIIAVEAEMVKFKVIYNLQNVVLKLSVVKLKSSFRLRLESSFVPNSRE